MTTDPSNLSPFHRWKLALKPASWPKIAVPTFLGVAVAYEIGIPDYQLVALATLFAIAQGIFIVLLNDWADQKVDRLKREMFPESSLKTIPDGILDSRTVLVAGTLSATFAIGCGVFLYIWCGRAYAIAGALLCVAIFAMYSLPPFRLNYRGGGELLETFGVGFALPWYVAYVSTGVLWDPTYYILIGHSVFALSSALASGLSDERSDKAGGKNTFTTWLGNRQTRWIVDRAIPGAILCWAATAIVANDTALYLAMFPTAILTLSFHTRMRTVSRTAVTDAFDEIRLYKLHLHRSIWGGTLTLAFAVTFMRSVLP